jgi:putative peptidoglycan lipid II flippase
MINDLFSSGKKLFLKPQNSILSAASIIMFMVVVSRVLGLVRQRTLAHYFIPSDLSLFFAAFRLPDTIFEVLVFGTFSSAFIPVFAKLIKRDKADAWDVAGRVVNIGLLSFLGLALIFGAGAEKIYSVIAGGYSENDIKTIASLARILFFAQGFFVVSYVLTGVLESLRRFLIPALAPVFYNLGIIFGTILLSDKYGLMGPVIGVVIGAGLHLLIQLPMSLKLGFRFSKNLGVTPEVGRVGTLAAPRVIDLAFDQIGKNLELFLASLISKASFTYFTFANTLQVLPITLFGTSLAKAALPSLSQNDDNPERFRSILLSTIYQAIFFAAPFSAALIVLRIPIIRLVYGTDIFDWEATVQTGTVLSVFALGVTFQILVSILSRAFFALHDTKTPVKISLLGLTILVIGDLVLVLKFKFPVWALAASFSAGYFVESIILYVIMNKKINKLFEADVLKRIGKMFAAAIASAGVMYFFLKFFDRYNWIKSLSFVGQLEPASIPFEKFVLDTRYTFDLVILTAIVFVFGIATYLGLLIFTKSPEIGILFGLLRRVLRRQISPIPDKETETVSPTTTDTGSS